MVFNQQYGSLAIPYDTMSVAGNEKALIDIVRQALDDGKAQNVVSIDLKGKSDIADFMVIASGTSSRHASSLGHNLIKHLKLQSRLYQEVLVEGINEGNWVLIDAGDVVVHIFKPEIREHYNLEKMWSMETPVELVAG